MVGIAREACLQLVRGGSEFGQVVLASSARRARGRRRVDRRGCANREINRYGCRGQQTGDTNRGANAPGGLCRIGRSEPTFFPFPISCREHSSGSLGSCGGGLLLLRARRRRPDPAVPELSQDESARAALLLGEPR